MKLWLRFGDSDSFMHVYLKEPTAPNSADILISRRYFPGFQGDSKPFRAELIILGEGEHCMCEVWMARCFDAEKIWVFSSEPERHNVTVWAYKGKDIGTSDHVPLRLLPGLTFKKSPVRVALVRLTELE